MNVMKELPLKDVASFVLSDLEVVQRELDKLRSFIKEAGAYEFPKDSPEIMSYRANLSGLLETSHAIKGLHQILFKGNR
jgi:hypothetical protein